MYSFRTLLALVHPIMPFVSERLWGVLPAAAGAQPQPLISAAWPAHAGAIDQTAIAQYQASTLARPTLAGQDTSAHHRHVGIRALRPRKCESLVSMQVPFKAKRGLCAHS